MSSVKHVNTGNCKKCAEIFYRYRGFHDGLQAWFKFYVQDKNNDAHISQAGRGEYEQELFYAKGLSKARWLDSAHNYNMAIDIFRLTQANALSYDRGWFKDVVGQAVLLNNRVNDEFKLTWYGFPGARFFELPHVEVTSWLELVETGVVTPVE